MKYPLTFFSVVVLLWCSCCVLRASLPWTVPACVVSQTFFALVGILGLQKHPPEGWAYELFFVIGFGSVLVFACWFALESSSAWFALITFNWCLYLALVLMHSRRPHTKLVIAFGTILLWCGILALVSLSKTLRPELHYSTLALGMFWLLLGVTFLCCAIGATRNRELWQIVGDLVPPTIALIAFGGLALMLWGGPQAELSRQSVSEFRQVARQEAR